MHTTGSALGLIIDDLSWAESFGAQLPSTFRRTLTDPTNPDVSTADTIQLMAQHSQADISHPVIQSAIAEIRDSSRRDDDESLIEATFEYVKEKVVFVEDEEILKRVFGVEGGTELLISPARLLTMSRPMGDCDDHSMLVKSLLNGMGIPAHFITVAADRHYPKKWSHVYNLATQRDGRTVAVDASHGRFVGDEAQQISRKDVWITKEEKEGLGMFSQKYERDEHGLAALIGLGADGDFGGEAGAPIPVPDRVGGGSGGSGGMDWGAFLSPLIGTTSKIAIAQYGQPNLQPGTFIRDANGAIVTNQPITGGFMPGFGSGGGGFGISSGMLIGIAVIGGILLFAKR